MIRIETDGRASVVRLTLARPERRNALDRETVTRLTEAVHRFGADAGVRVLVLAGDGPVFSAGADLDALSRLQDASFDENLEDSRRLADLFLAMRRCPVPIVARVHGHAVAGGCGLVAAADLSVAVSEAKFGFTEVRIGFVPALVSVLLGGRIAGASARDLLLTGRLVSAREAHGMGLVSRVVEDSALDTAVDDIVTSLARDTSRQAVATTKRLLFDLAGKDEVSAMDLAARVNAEARGTEDCRAGVRSFLDRTDPPWKAGR